MSILDILENSFKVFFISYIDSIVNSKLIYVRKIQEVLSKMFHIIKKFHRKKKKKDNKFLKSLMAANNKCTNSPLGNSTMNNNDINNDVYINFREGNNTIYICPMKDYFKNKYKSNDDSNNNDNSNNNDDSNNNEDSNNEDSTTNNNTEERHPFNKVEPICPEHKSTSELNKKRIFS